MKILHVLPAYVPAVRYGGPVFAVQGLCRELAARGHEVGIMTTSIDGARDSDVPLSGPVDRDGVKVSYFSSPRLRRLFFAPAMAPALRRDVARYDLIHLHTLYQWPTWAAARVARAQGVPYVLSPRGMLVKDLIRQRSYVAKSLWIAVIERGNIERAAALHVTSPVEAQEVQRFGWRLPAVVTVANGVDAPSVSIGEVAADVRAATECGPIILSLGRLSWKKGLDRLLQAMACTEGGVLVIAGTDDERLGPRLGALARDLGLGARVRIVPRTVEGADKEHLFAAARLFVVPSLSENFGNTVLEAMRRGVPVVTTPEVGAADIVRCAAGGIVCDGAPAALARAMTQLLRDPALAKAMGKSGHNHVVAHYGWPQIAADMERLYAGVISG